MQEKKHEVIVSGVPKIENIPKDSMRIFCETVLREVEEYFSHNEKEKSTIESEEVIKRRGTK